MSQTMCACGRPLHYSDPSLRSIMEDMIEKLGERIRVTHDGRTWLVPRHYIALHGIKAWELGTDKMPAFEEVSP